jgi:hypothetical protein
MPILKPTDVKPRPQYRLFVRFEDGVEGEVDLSHLAGRGVFKVWDEPGAFQQVVIGSSGQIRWTDDVEICSDAVYLELTGKSASEVFGSGFAVATDARD